MQRATLFFLFIVVVAFLLAHQATASASGSAATHHDDDDHDDDHHDDHDDHGNSTNGTAHDDHDDHDHATDGHSEAEHGADAMKGMSIAVIGGVAIIVALGVLAFPALRTQKTLMHLVSAFAAGIFLVVGLGHLLGEAVDILNGIYSERNAERLRPAYMVAIGGYFFMVILQRAVLASSHDHDLDDDESVVSKEDEVEELAKGSHDAVAGSPVAVVATSAPEEGAVEGTAASPSEPYAEGEPKTVREMDQEEPHTATTKKDAAVAKQQPPADPQSQRHHQLAVAVMFIGFFIHGVVEGIALGLQSTKNGVILVFIAIVTHHWAHDLIFTFATGKITGMGNVARALLSIFCSMNTPIGIGIGWGLHSAIPSEVTAYILAFSAGTFLMIALTDIIPEVMPSGKRNIPQCAAAVFGVGIMYMALTLMYSEEAHDH